MPADAPAQSALDALLAEVEVASKWMTYATRDYLARTAAPRLAAIVRVLVGAAKVSRAMNEVLGAEMRASRLSQVAALLDTALARAEAIASGRDPATTTNPTTPTIPADAPASDAGSTTQHKEP